MDNINKLVELFLTTKPENTIFYNKIEDKLFIMTPEMLSNVEIILDDGRHLGLDEIMDNRNDYLIFNFSYEDLEYFICDDFLKHLIFNYKKEVIELRKSINMKRGKVNKSFYTKLEKYNFMETFNDFKEKRVKDVLEDYMYHFNSINVKLDNENLQDTFINIRSLYREKIWEQFPNVNLIKVKTQEYGTFYVSVLGNNKECYGFNIYKEDNVDGYAYITDPCLDKELVLSLQENFTIYYDIIEEIDEDMIQLINDSGVDFSNEEMTGYFLYFNKFRYPTINISNSLLRTYNEVLRVLGKGINKMKEKKMLFDVENGESLEIIQQSDYKIRTRTYNVVSLKIYPRVIKPFQYSNLDKKNNLNVEMKLVSVNTRILENYMVDPVWTMLLIVCDRDSGMILDEFIAIEESGLSPLYIIQNKLDEFINEKGCPKTITVDDTLTYLLISTLSNECEIVSGDLTADFKEIIENMKLSLERDENTAEA